MTLRKIQVTYKTALFMLHRIRHGMADGPDAPKLTGTVEADETYVGGKPRHPQMVDGRIKKGWNPDKPKTPVFAVVQRGGEVRAGVMPTVTAENVKNVLLQCAEPTVDLMTDESRLYKRIGSPVKSHSAVKHRDREYVDPKNPNVHTNTVEGFFSRLKRGLNGTYYAVSPKHLPRYVAQYAWLYNARELNDGERTAKIIRDANGKRLRYREPA